MIFQVLNTRVKLLKMFQLCVAKCNEVDASTQLLK